MHEVVDEGASVLSGRVVAGLVAAAVAGGGLAGCGESDTASNEPAVRSAATAVIGAPATNPDDSVGTAIVERIDPPASEQSDDERALNRYRSYTKAYWAGYTPSAYGWTNRTAYRLNGLGTKIQVRTKFTEAERADAEILARDICGKHWTVLVSARQDGVEGLERISGIEVKDRDGSDLASCP